MRGCRQKITKKMKKCLQLHFVCVNIIGHCVQICVDVGGGRPAYRARGGEFPRSMSDLKTGRQLILNGT